MISNTLVLAGRDTQNRAGGDVAGLKLKWLAENVEGDIDDPVFRAVTLTAHKSGILSKLLVELLADAPCSSRSSSRASPNQCVLGSTVHFCMVPVPVNRSEF